MNWDSDRWSADQIQDWYASVWAYKNLTQKNFDFRSFLEPKMMTVIKTERKQLII